MRPKRGTPVKDSEQVDDPSTEPVDSNVTIDNSVSELKGNVDLETLEPMKASCRPPKKRPIVEADEESSLEPDLSGDTSAIDLNPDDVSEDVEPPHLPKKRGRKPKNANQLEDKYVPDPKKRGIMVGSEAPLRRRDKIAPIARYSPPPHQPSRRGRSSRGHVSFPSTSSSSKYISFDSDEEGGATGSKRGVGGSRYSSGRETKSYVVDVKKDETSNKMLIMLPDGTTYKVDATPVPAGAKAGKRKVNEDDEEFDVEDDGAFEDPQDDEYKPTYNERKKLKTDVTDSDSGTDKVKAPRTPARQAKISRPMLAKKEVTVVTGGAGSLSKVVVAPSKDGTRTTTITSGTPGKTKVTFITTPRSVTLTPAFKQPPKRSYGAGQAKFIDELPEISECTTGETLVSMAKLPDKVLFVASELPLRHELVQGEHSKIYAFRQIMSPQMASFSCLLCPVNKYNLKTERELNVHYSTVHELAIEKTSAKFSDSIVFCCLPRSTINQINAQDMASVDLNSPCQYCGDDLILKTVDDMRTHYKDVHNQDIELIEQEVMLDMHKSLFCSVCSLGQFNTFSDLVIHCQTDHQLNTYQCKGCPFFTQDPTRLKTHFKAKHMISSSMSNVQCVFCNGLLMGSERMNKHIMSAHCVQTAVGEYSCTACLQVCGKVDQLLTHSYRCPAFMSREKDKSKAAGQGVEHLATPAEKSGATYSKESKENAVVAVGDASLQSDAKGSDPNSPMDTPKDVPREVEAPKKLHKELEEMVPRVETTCFLCDLTFSSAEQCNLHLTHVHTKWITRSVVHDTFLMVRHADGKTDLLPKSDIDNEDGHDKLRIEDLESMNVLENVGVKAAHGHYCHKCELVISVYPLYYMHMFNFHKQEKMFQCKVASCRQVFPTSLPFQEHVKATGHPQKSVIEDTLGAISCHYCDVSFKDRKEFEAHHMADEHYSKLALLSDKHTMKAEPRNYKCKTCHTWFGLFDSFVDHMQNETHKHGCPYCGLAFALPSSRRTHIQSHHIDKQDICEICSKSQGSKERLFAHLVEHEVVFECNTCMKKFYQREQLNSHMEQHGDPVDCPWEGCSKRIGLSLLSTHIRQHRVEVNSKCNICNTVFQNQLLLVSHMDVHAKADSNAKAILNSVATTVGTMRPVIQGLTTTNSSRNGQSDRATTLISITTPKVPTPTSLITGIKQRVSNIKPSNRQRTYQRQQYPIKTEIPEGLRVMCCTCSQLFNSQPELYNHKCDSSSKNSTKTTTAISQNGRPTKSAIEDSLITTLIPEGNNSSHQLTLGEDPEKFVLDLAAQLTQADQQMVMTQDHGQGQVYQIDLQNPTSVNTIISSVGNSMIKPKNTYTRNKTQKAKTTKTINNQNNPNHTANTIQLNQDSTQQTMFLSGDQIVIAADQNQVQPSEPTLAGGDNVQMLMLQQPDGQYVQICVPAGMDVNDVLQSIYGGDSTSTLSADQILVSQEGQEGEQELIQIHQEQPLAMEGGENLPQDNEQQSTQQVIEATAQTADGEQIIYIPVNEDGTYAIDAESLALLTGGGDLPQITRAIN